jgi:hypothetical protein
MPLRLAIVTPVLDDWPSFVALAKRIATLFPADGSVIVDIFAIDDGSQEQGPDDASGLAPAGCVASIEILHLVLNLGHQRAIAIGLVEIAGQARHDAVVVMDSDGEDRPEDVVTLVAAARAWPRRIVLAHRAKRSEPLLFRLGYLAYKTLFRALSGRRIGFGNFCLLPLAAVQRLVHMPEAWNHLAAAVMRSRFGYDEIPTERGRRYDGTSHMNLTTLVLHGLSAISVYIDVIFVRVLLVAASLVSVALLGIVIVLFQRFFTHLATPGWATSAIGALLGIMMQTVILVFVMTLVVLSSRGNSPVIPILDCGKYIRARRRLPPAA